jgi:hypothetical protein
MSLSFAQACEVAVPSSDSPRTDQPIHPLKHPMNITLTLLRFARCHLVARLPGIGVARQASVMSMCSNDDGEPPGLPVS